MNRGSEQETTPPIRSSENGKSGQILSYGAIIPSQDSGKNISKPLEFFLVRL